MTTIFLSHTSIDKPFVEKLAKDLQNLGIQVWFDRYQIKVGESILWKIDEGIRDSEYLAIVISKEALESEWVKTEITAAWQKQVEQKGNFILPIYYRECEIPLILQGIKYADFRTNYDQGLEDLVKVFGIDTLTAITEDNWRLFAKKRTSNWKEYRDKEFENVITKIYQIAKNSNFSIWVGNSKNPYAFVISGWIDSDAKLSIGVRMNPSNGYMYMGAHTNAWNPQHIDKEDYNIKIGTTPNEVEEYISCEVYNFVSLHGKPKSEPHYFTKKPIKIDEQMNELMEFMKAWDWNKL